MCLKQLIIITIGFCLTCFSFLNGQPIQKVPDSLLIRTISIEGNLRTKTSVVKKEIPICENQKIAGDIIDVLQSEIKRNLIKTSLFNFVEVTLIVTEDKYVDVVIKLQERWYFIPRLKIKTEEENINAWAEKHDFGHLTTSFSITDENFRGMHEDFCITGSIGFNKSIGLKYLNPMISKSLKIGAGFEVSYTQNKEIMIGLFDYKPKYYFNSNNSLLSTFQLAISAYYRPTLNIDELLTISYVNNKYFDSLKWINRFYYPDNFKNSIRISSKLKFDFRDHKSYPLSGSYFDIIAENNTQTNSTQTNINNTSLIINGRLYKKVGTHSFIAMGGVFASMLTDECLVPNGLHVGQSGLELRSFEQLQIPVKSLFVAKSTLKYQLLNVAKQQIKWVHNPKFAMIHYALYATLFADGAYANYYTLANYEEYTHFKNNWLGSTGIGLDFSAYYDMVIRAEYSYNFVFDKYYFFIHFKTAI